MKVLSGRKEIVKGLRSGMPIIRFDVSQVKHDGTLVESNLLILDYGRNKIPVHCWWSKGETKFSFWNSGCCIKSSFSYSDIEDIFNEETAPVIYPDQDVIILIVDSKNEISLAPIVLHTSKRINQFCQNPITFVDKDYTTEEFTDALKRAGIDIFN